MLCDNAKMYLHSALASCFRKVLGRCTAVLCDNSSVLTATHGSALSFGKLLSGGARTASWWVDSRALSG